MPRLLRYTLTALRRGLHRRGDVVTVVEGSSFDLEHRSDPAWSATAMHAHVPTPGPEPDRRAQGAYRALLTFVREQAARVEALGETQREAYLAMLIHNRHELEEAVEMAFGATPKPAGPDPGALDEPPPEAEPSQAQEADAPEVRPSEPAASDPRAELASTLDAIIAGTDPSTTIEALVAAARAAGLAVPAPLPRRRVDVATALRALTHEPSTAPTPADLGDD